MSERLIAEEPVLLALRPDGKLALAAVAATSAASTT